MQRDLYPGQNLPGGQYDGFFWGLLPVKRKLRSLVTNNFQAFDILALRWYLLEDAQPKPS